MVVAGAWLAACGSSGTSNGNPPPPATGDQGQDSGTPTPTPEQDASTVDAADAAPPADHGQPSTTYPAFVPDIAQLVDNGGVKLTAPKIVTITWPGETNADYYESFADNLGKTDYWKALVGEYGIGATVSDATTHVRMTKALATLADADIDALVTANVTGATVGTTAPDGAKWPAPDENTLYVLYIPSTTKFTIDQGNGPADICTSGIGGWHAESNDMKSVYAIIPQCQRTGITIKDDATESASHEIAEASLDPRGQVQFADGGSEPQGWWGVDDAHWGWMQFMQLNVENGDLCEFDRDSFYENKEAGFDFSVQRQWSNKAAKAGKSPCQPQDTTTAYFNTTLLTPQQVALDLTAFGGSKGTTNGVVAAIGQTVSFEVGYFSDGPHDAWTVYAVEGNPYLQQQGSTPRLSNISVDKTTGVNGEKAVVSATVVGLGRIGTAVLNVVSSKGGQPCDRTHSGNGEICHFSPIMIGKSPTADAADAAAE
jgi:hypothetical protein